MPTNLATVAVILLFVAPGFVYYSARFNAERQASEQPGALAARPSWTSDPLRQIVDSIIASTLLSGAAVGSFCSSDGSSRGSFRILLCQAPEHGLRKAGSTCRIIGSG
jgi:hypothetical protein